MEVVVSETQQVVTHRAADAPRLIPGGFKLHGDLDDGVGNGQAGGKRHGGALARVDHGGGGTGIGERAGPSGQVVADLQDHRIREAQPHSTLPPFTLRISPVMCRASSLHRNTTGPAMSAALATRPSGIARSISPRLAPPASAYAPAAISVSTHPGATQFTLMWRGASSIARDLVKAMTAPLVAA